MRVKVTQIGDDIGVEIPQELAARAGLTDGSQVEIDVVGARLAVSSARPKYRLEDLLRGMTAEAMREAFDWGPDDRRDGGP